MTTLVYSHECPYCRTIVKALKKLNTEIEYTSIEGPYGRALVESQHGEYVHAPHLFEDEKVYYGVGPVTKRLFAKHIP